MNVKDRLKAWPSTMLGVGAGVVIALQQSLGCQYALTDVQVWLPAVILALAGSLIKGPEKKSDDEGTK